MRQGLSICRIVCEENFVYQVPANGITAITRMIITIQDGSNDLFPDEYGGMSALTNGITVKIKDKNKLIDVEKELSSLNETVKQFIPDQKNVIKLIEELKEINLKLWDIENEKRSAEKNKDFGKKFIELARSVYKTNDERAKIKLEINLKLGSNIKEVKSYE